MYSRKHLFRGYKLQKPNMTDLERDQQRPRPRKPTINGRRRTWTPSAGRWSCFSFLFQRSPNNFRFAFLALKVASQAFTQKISISWAKIDYVLPCSFRGELVARRARLRIADGGDASQLQLTERKEQGVAQRGLRAQAWKLELKSSPGNEGTYSM